jgi:FKBP-type peptidyl-prolyl cis-trans isomerase 2
MTSPKQGDIVSIDYVVRTGDGTIVGNTEEEGPQDIQLGGGQIFPQIELALSSMKVGDEETVEIPCDSAFGPRREEMIIEIPRANLPSQPAPQPGMALQAQGPDGQPIVLHIVEVGEQSVKADGNHPLAGQDITFAVTLREIKIAA